jgi:hypothetical protein
MTLLVHTDPEENEAVVRYVGNAPIGRTPKTPRLAYYGRNAILFLADSTAARILMTSPEQAFFAMYRSNELKNMPYGQIDVSHLFTDLPFDTLQASISGLCLVTGRNVLTSLQFTVTD